MTHARSWSSGPGSLFRPLGVRCEPLCVFLCGLQRRLASGSTGHRAKMLWRCAEMGAWCCSGPSEPEGCLTKGTIWPGLHAAWAGRWRCDITPLAAMLSPRSPVLGVQSSVLSPQSSVLSPQSSVLSPQSSVLAFLPWRALSYLPQGAAFSDYQGPGGWSVARSVGCTLEYKS